MHLKTDVDYFSFSPAGAGTAIVHFRHDNAELSGATWKVQVYDQNDTLLTIKEIKGTETVATPTPFP